MNWETLACYSYAPYSGNPACCVVVSREGVLFPGVRIENLSYPLTITPEQAALSSCLSEGYTPVKMMYRAESGHNSDFWVDEFDLNLEISPDFPGGELFDPVTVSEAPVFKKLKKLISNSITPNSGFPVSAVLRTGRGDVGGVNIEYRAWNMGLCAERVAISKAISAGIRAFESIGIYAPKSDFTSPCGACRQVMTECMQDQPVELYHGDGTHSSYFVRHLLPYAFSTTELKRKEIQKKD